MVSNASDDFPEPDGPVMTVKVRRGISRSKFLRLCWRAPRTMSWSFTEGKLAGWSAQAAWAVHRSMITPSRAWRAVAARARRQPLDHTACGQDHDGTEGRQSQRPGV